MKYKVIYAFNDKYDLSQVHSVGEDFVSDEEDRIRDLLEREYIELVPDEEPNEGTEDKVDEEPKEGTEDKVDEEPKENTKKPASKKAQK